MIRNRNRLGSLYLLCAVGDPGRPEESYAVFVFEINTSHSKKEFGDLSKNMPKSDVIGHRPALWCGSQFPFSFQIDLTNASMKKMLWF